MRAVAGALLGTLLLLTACSGTQEARTPVYLVVADGDSVGVISSPLPPGTAPGSGSFEWLEGFERTVGGEVVDLAVARDLPTQVFAAYRDGTLGSDHVQRFAAGAVRPGAPETFTAEGEPIDIGALVRAAGPLTSPDLCTQAVRASSDARWLAVLHEPSACGLGTAGAAVVLFDLAGDTPDSAEVAFPAVVSAEDAASPPVFLPSPGGSEPGAMVYMEADGAVVRVSLPEDGDVDVVRSRPLGTIEPVALGTGGLGLVVAEADAVHTFGTWSVGEPVTVASDPLVTSVVDADTLPNTPLVLVTDLGLMVRTGIAAAEPREPGELMIDEVADAVVGPYGYAFVMAQDRIVVVDLLTYAGSSTGSDLDRLSSYVVPALGGSDLPIDAPVAIDWIFGAVPTADP